LKDGGPVIGIQLENEYSNRGKYGGEEYILALKRLAITSGLDVPFYSVTGWDNAVVPVGVVLPVFGGYPDALWGSSRESLTPGEVYMFRFGSRVTGNMGTIGAKSETRPATKERPETPFLTAEMGGGIQDNYHRRPVVSPDDIVAMFPVMLGSGVNLYGTTWTIGMKRFFDRDQTSNLQLSILPLRADSPIFLEDTVRKSLPSSGQFEQLRSVTAIPQYQLTLQTGNQAATTR
jgi:hypothetical protein